jgi:phosphoesterase RecJ-like protein
MRYGPVIDFLTGNEKFILTVHETPDGDALGSEFALLWALRRMGKTARILNADPAPEKFTFLDRKREARVLTSVSQVPIHIEDYVLVILDVSDIRNIGVVSRWVLPRVRQYFIIDHHESDRDLLSPNHIEQSASSTCEILYLVFQEMGVDIDLRMAHALFMGIVYDTGSFIYPKTTATTFQIARELVELGVNPNEVHANVFENNSLSSLVLMSRILSTLTLYLDGRVAVQIMTRKILHAANAKYEEADQQINIPLRSKDVRVSIFFKENPEGIQRCSLRSKGKIDVSEIAKRFGGGGHRTAAGFKFTMPMETVQNKILLFLKKKYFSRKRGS